MPNDPSQPAPMISRAIHSVENVFLLLIAAFTVVAMVQEIIQVAEAQRVAVQDLLLMFIYVEVLGMVGIYYDSKKIPIVLPIFIAITALSRLVILQGKDQPPVNLLYESIAILLLAIACFVISSRSLDADRRIGNVGRRKTSKQTERPS